MATHQSKGFCPSSQPKACNHNVSPPRPRLREGIICHLNLASGYGFLKPTAPDTSPSLASLVLDPDARIPGTLIRKEDQSSNIYFKIPDPSSMHSSCHTGFMALQVGDTLEFISQHNAEKPRAIYTRLIACCSRSTDNMASYLHHLISLVNAIGAQIDSIVQETTKAPKGILLVLQHPNPDRKLSLIILKLAVAISDHYQKKASPSCKSKIKDFFHLLARTPFICTENAALCKLLIWLQESNFQASSHLPLYMRLFNIRKATDLKLLCEIESEWGRPLSTVLVSTKTLVLRILREIPEELPYLFQLIQILNSMQIECQGQPTDSKVLASQESSFAMQVVDTIAHASGMHHVHNLNVSWNKLSLLPLASEIVNSIDNTTPFMSLPIAKLKGNYDSPEDYIDTYFRLLREDAFASLMKGISNFSSGRLDPRDMNVWFDVSAIGVHFEQSLPGIVAALQLTEGQANKLHPKLPLAGSLLCICDSGGCFRNPTWATVARCESKSKKTTVLFVDVLKGTPASDCEYSKSLSPWARILQASSMVVAECPAYYKAYEPVLKALQQLDVETMPFQSDLVFAKSSGRAPHYLNSSTILDWSCLSAPNSSSAYGDLKAGVDALVPPTLPGLQTTLDSTQVDAVNHVLQNQLAIIQGPPGTGKTFLSVKIAELLLSASSRPQKPMLIVTYKNQALDQFLESCLKFCTANSIVRVGGSSKGDKLASCNLQYLLRTGQHNKLSSSDWIANCTKLEELETELRQALSNLHRCRTFNMETIASQSSLQGFLQKLLTMRGDKLNPTESTSTDTSRSTESKGLPGPVQKEHNKILKQWMPQKSVFETCFPRFIPTSRTGTEAASTRLRGKTAATEHDKEEPDDLAEENEEKKEFDHLWQDVRRVSQRDQKDRDWLSNRFLNLADFHFNKNEPFGRIARGDLDLDVHTWLLEADPWELSEEHRCILILLIMQKNSEECTKKFAEIKEQYDQVCLENAEINKQRRIAILREAKIIGMTTTGAAINQDILAAISPAIILVEEAAEILEPHLMALLSPSVQHLILIGDHKQLRPSVECYQLEQRHNLGCSMLERLAEHNKLPFQTLGLQSRMREEFLQMVKPVYPNLKSNISVVNGVRNQPAKCMESTMYFWNHSVNETAGRSPSNKQEVHMVIALVKWLLSEGHTHNEISVICSYNGQVSEIRKRLSEFKQEAEETVNVQTIDRFQGSENRIIIASLVRSNREGNIGHLFAQNRLCVTVSRARAGFYLCGNAETLSQKSPHWKTLINCCFKAQNCLGENISLVCPRHPKHPAISLHSDDAVKFSPNVCKKPCKAQLPCGHYCQKTCHYGEHALCKEQVPHIFPKCQHSTMKPCSQPDTSLKCSETVWITLEICSHKKECMCWEKTEKVSSAMACRLTCGKTLPCEHPCTLFCSQNCASKPCPTCAKIEKIKAQREEELRVKLMKEKLSNIHSQIEKLKSGPEVGPTFKILEPEGDTAVEYHMVKDRTEKFVQPTHKVLPIVVKIEKVTNAKLQLKFLQAQQELRDVLAPTQLLFHGTDDEGVKGITTNGFRLPSPSKNNMFGVGCYFATDSSKSAQQLYTKGSNKLLLCEVLLGRSWSLTSARRDLDRHLVQSKMYDSVFSIRDNRDSGGTQYDEYIIYNPDQALPKYVVHYKNLDCNSFDLWTFQNKANITFGRQVLDASPSSYKGATNDEMHFRFAEAQFLRMSSNRGTKKVTKVEYTWNQVLHDQFEKRKLQFKAQNKPVSESLVFHGTQKESIDKIVKDGFKVGGTEGVAIRYGAKYGPGVYTAADPETSIPYSNGSGMMLLSIAICGKVNEDYNEGGEPDIFVVKRGDQLLPRYIVHFC